MGAFLIFVVVQRLSIYFGIIFVDVIWAIFLVGLVFVLSIVVDLFQLHWHNSEPKNINLASYPYFSLGAIWFENSVQGYS
jgi:hypothetical protein